MTVWGQLLNVCKWRSASSINGKTLTKVNKNGGEVAPISDDEAPEHRSDFSF